MNIIWWCFHLNKNRNAYFVIIEFSLLFVYILLCVINLLKGKEFFSFVILFALLGAVFISRGIEKYILKDKKYIYSILCGVGFFLIAVLY